jgi:hypothetical protein
MLTDSQNKLLDILSWPMPGPPPNVRALLKHNAASAAKTKSWGPIEANAELSRWYAKYPNHLLPAHLKVPKDFDEKTGEPRPLKNWNRPHNLACLQRAANAAGNFGLRTSQFPVGDIDCSNPRVADAVEAAIAAEVKQPLSIRFRSNSPKRSILFTLRPGASPFRKKWVEAVDENGEKQLVEFLADGQQSIIAGVHPTGVLIQWAGPHPAEVGPEGLPTIDAAGAERLLAVVKEAMERAGCTSVKQSTAAKADPGKQRKKIGDPSFLAPSLELLARTRSAFIATRPKTYRPTITWCGF